MRLLRRLPLLLLAMSLAGCGLVRDVEQDPAAIPDGPLEATVSDPTGPVTELGRARTLGIGWRYATFPSAEGWCTQLETATVTTGGCGDLMPSGATAFGSVGRGGPIGGAAPVEGVVRPDVAEVWIETATGERIETTLMSLAAAGIEGSAFVGFAPENVVISAVVAVDADGQVLETYDLP